MIERLAFLVVTRLIAWLVDRHVSKSQCSEPMDHAEIEKKAESLKLALSEVHDGQPVTPEQREKLNKAIIDFVSPHRAGGL